jgi:hypothetical protein
MNGILLPAYVEGIASRKDKTVKITLSTQELDPEKAGELFGINGQLVTVHINPVGIKQDDISAIESLEFYLPGKRPSERLRAVLYLMWKNNPQGFKDQHTHYQHYMDKIIEFYKDKLPK